jgi:Tfp pilus assembly protein PilN
MIKINLSSTKRSADLSDVGGFDLTQIKIKAVLIAIVVMYLPDFVATPMWEEEYQRFTLDLTIKTQQLNKLQKKVSQTENFEKQIRELKAQEESLEKKLTAVKETISEKRNPSSILLYIAKNIPKELWINELNLDGDALTVKGEALDYTSIGNFVNNLRSSVFIKDASISNTTSNVRETDKKRIEAFEVKFTIGRLNQ